MGVSSVVRARHELGCVELATVFSVQRYQRMLSAGFGEPVHVPTTAVTLPLEDGVVASTPLIVVNLGATVFAGELPTAIDDDAEKREVFGAPFTGVTLTTRNFPMSAVFATYWVGDATVVACTVEHAFPEAGKAFAEDRMRLAHVSHS